jgi:hypothetical protein
MIVNNIYFVGKAGAGKTYATSYLIKKYGYIHCKFAYPVYNLAKNYFNMKNKDRHLLQYLGTDVARNLIDKDIWIKRFKENIKIVDTTYKKLYNKDIAFALDDCRFQNEHEVLQNLGWVGIYLSVDDTLRIKRLKKRDGDAQVNTLKHSSELEIDKFKNNVDFTIDASGTIKDTQAQIDKIIKTLEKIGGKNGIRNF